MEIKKKSLLGPVLAVALLLAVFLAVRWVVTTKRGPGSMTVVEAQAMDMTAMRAPIGVFPVGTEYALERRVGGTETFPATVVALSDEDVVARVAGLVKDVKVYPGDRVAVGQLLATLQADELGSTALAQALAAQAVEGNARSAESALSQQRSAVSRAEAELDAASALVETAKAELEAEGSHIVHVTHEVEEAAALKAEAEAQLEYAQIEYAREQALYKAGAISRDELDAAKRDLDAAKARVDQAEAKRMQSSHLLTARKADERAAANRLKSALARERAAAAALAEAKSGVGRAQADLSAARDQASSARASAGAAGALSSYTELRATDAGVVTERLVSPGTPVMAGQTVLKLKVDRELRVQAELPQRLANKVSTGSAVRIVVNERSLDATVTSVSPYVAGNTRSFRVEARIENPGHEIQAGSFAEVEVTTSSPVAALSVRREAVKTASDGAHYVWLVTEKEAKPSADAIYTCTMHPDVEQKGPGICPICKMDLVPKDATGNLSVVKREVKIGSSDSRYTAILDGLVEGDQVTFAGDSELFPGAAIMVVEWTESGPAQLPMGTGQSGHDHGTMQTEPSEPAADKASTMEGHEGHVHTSQDKYTCPMHPEVHKPGPDICPICKMDLVPIEEEGA